MVSRPGLRCATSRPASTVKVPTAGVGGEGHPVAHVRRGGRRHQGLLPHRPLAPVAHPEGERRVPLQQGTPDPGAGPQPGDVRRHPAGDGQGEQARPTGSPSTGSRWSSYLRGVVPREMPASWRPAALRAQAMAARAYRGVRGRRSHKPASTSATTTTARSTAALSGRASTTDKAIRQRPEQVRTYQGQPAFTRVLVASNGGWSRGLAQPLPRSRKQDPYDRWRATRTTTWTDRRVRRRDREGLAGARQPHAASGDRARRQREVERPGRAHDPARQQGRQVRSDRLHRRRTSASRLGLRSTWVNLSVAG